MPAVSVIIVNWNGERLLPDCLGSLRAQAYRDFEVILVDNGSRDQSVTLARELMPDAKIVALDENCGFAKANNIGIRAATGRFIVLLNNDTKADERFLSELVQTAESDQQAGMVAPKILNFFDSKLIDSVGGLLLCRDGIGQGRGRGEADQGQYDQVREALCPSGCAALYKKAMLDEIGGFADEFFAYCEDSDLGLRAVWAGWRCVAAPRAVIFHKYSASSSGYSPLKLRLVERNHYFLVLRNYPLSLLWTVPFWSLYRCLLMAWSLATGKGKGAAAGRGQLFPLFRAFVQGHWQAVWGAPRHYGQRSPLRRISNREFVSLLRKNRLALDRAFLTE